MRSHVGTVIGTIIAFSLGVLPAALAQDSTDLVNQLREPGSRTDAVDRAWSLPHFSPEQRTAIVDLLRELEPTVRASAQALLAAKLTALDLVALAPRLTDPRTPHWIRLGIAETFALSPEPLAREQLRSYARQTADPTLANIAAQALALHEPAGNASALRAWSAASARAARLEHRLVRALRSRYLRAPEPDRSALLRQFLQDSEHAVVRLGLELARGRLAEGRVLEPETSKLCRALLTDPDPRTRRAAVHTVTSLREPNDAAAFVACLQTERDVLVSAALLNGLGYLGTDADADTLAQWLARPEPELAFEALAALGRLGERGQLDNADPAAVRAVLNFAEARWHVDPTRRERIVWAATRFHDARFVPILTRAMRDPAPLVQTAGARGAAEKLRQTPAGAQLNDAERNTLIESLIELTAAAQPAARRAAVDALGGAGVARVADVLWQRAQRAVEPDERVRKQAWRSFLRVVAVQPLEALREKLRLLPATGDAVHKRIELLEAALAHHAAVDPADPLTISRIRIWIAEARDTAGQHDAAAAMYRQAVESLHQARHPFVQEASARYLDFSLRRGRYNETVANLFRTGNPPFEANIAERAARAALESLLEARSFERAERMHALLVESPPTEWSAAMTAWLADYKTRASAGVAEALRARLNNELNAALARPPAQAELQLAEQFPRQAARLLLDRLRQAIAEGDAVAQSRVVGLLRRVRPSWSGIPEDATPEVRAAALDQLAAQLVEPAPAAPAEE